MIFIDQFELSISNLDVHVSRLNAAIFGICFNGAFATAMWSEGMNGATVIVESPQGATPEFALEFASKVSSRLNDRRIRHNIAIKQW